MSTKKEFNTGNSRFIWSICMVKGYFHCFVGIWIIFRYFKGVSIILDICKMLLFILEIFTGDIFLILEVSRII